MPIDLLESYFGYYASTENIDLYKIVLVVKKKNMFTNRENVIMTVVCVTRAQ